MSTKPPPKNWQHDRLENLVFFQRGFDITKAQQRPGPYPVISSSGITSFHDEFKVHGPGVVIGRKGTLGSIHFTNGDYWPHDTTLWSKDLRGNNARFVYYFLHTIDMKRFDVGNSNPTLNRNHIHSQPVLIPRRDIQDRISDLLSKYDDLIENNLRRIALLEKAARLIYEEWIVRLRFPGYEHTRIVDGVPEGWRKKRVKEFGAVVTGKTPSTKVPEYYGGEIPFVKTPDMHGRAFVLYTAQYLTENGANSQKNKYIPVGALMVSCIGTIGVVSIASEKCQTNQQINSVLLNKEIFSYLCYFAFQELKQRMEALGGGATMNNVNKTKFENLDLICPSDRILEAFHEIVSPNFHLILNLQRQNRRLNEARTLLLPRLMSGEIAV